MDPSMVWGAEVARNNNVLADGCFLLFSPAIHWFAKNNLFLAERGL